MRVMIFRLPAIAPMPRRQLWRDTGFFLASFIATLGGAVVVMEHAAAVLS